MYKRASILSVTIYVATLIGCFCIPITSKAAILYQEDFESFSIGDINGQNAWAGELGNWTIADTNPADGSQHLRGVSNGLGRSGAFSPTFVDDITSEFVYFATNVAIIPGATWQIIPQAIRRGLVATRIIVNQSGGIEVLIDDPSSASGTALLNTGQVIPDGYFSVFISLERGTQAYSISINDVEIFSGTSLTNSIDQIVFLGVMEPATVGSTLDIDNIIVATSLDDFPPPGDDPIEIPVPPMMPIFALAAGFLLTRARHRGRIDDRTGVLGIR